MNRQLTIEEVLERHPFVLVDTSFFGGSNLGPEIGKRIFGMRYPYQVNSIEEKLEKYRSNLVWQTREVIEHPNVYTTERVLGDVSEFLGYLRRRVRLLSGDKKIKKRNRRGQMNGPELLKKASWSLCGLKRSLKVTDIEADEIFPVRKNIKPTRYNVVGTAIKYCLETEDQAAILAGRTRWLKRAFEDALKGSHQDFSDRLLNDLFIYSPVNPEEDRVQRQSYQVSSPYPMSLHLEPTILDKVTLSPP